MTDEVAKSSDGSRVIPVPEINSTRRDERSVVQSTQAKNSDVMLLSGTGISYLQRNFDRLASNMKRNLRRRKEAVAQDTNQ